MKPDYIKLSFIITAGVAISGLVWLFIYNLRFHKGIGFDGTSGGILGMTLAAGWLVSTAIALVWFWRKTHKKLFAPLLLALAIGMLAIFAVGYGISAFASKHYIDRHMYFREQ
jgi:hypothetical protein